MSLASAPVGRLPLGAPAALVLAVPPEPAGAGSGGLSHLLPAVGVLPLLALGGGHRSPLLLVALLASSIGGALAVAGLTRRQRRRAHRDLVGRWRSHRCALETQADAAATLQRHSLDRAYPADLGALVEAGAACRRRRSDPFALHVCIGTGAVAALTPVVRAPAGPLQPVDLALAAEADALVARTAALRAAPVVVALPAVGVLAVHGPRAEVRAALRAIVVQLAALHAHGELELALVDSEFDAEVSVPQRVTGISTVAALVPWLTEPGPGPPRAAVIADPDLAEQAGLTSALAELVAAARGVGRTHSAALHAPVAVVASHGLGQVPAGAVLDLTDHTFTPTDGEPQVLDAAEQMSVAAAQRLAALLTALVAPIGPDAQLRDLPSLLAALPLEPGQAPIGIGADGMPVVLDLREAARGGHGPHGLLVGATGSGKSVLLRTLVVGLAAHSPPTEQQFLLVDFKGGAAFADLAGLPHVVGLVTNLSRDPGLPARMVAALEWELDRRQRVLAASGAGDAAAAGLPALLVAVDEATELLAAEPAVGTVFAKIGRVGRSLGVHLLLASQRWEGAGLRGVEGHLRYRLCLRTLTVDDSRAVLGSDAALRLPARPGAGFLAVDATMRRLDVVAVPADPLALVASAPRATPIWLPPLPALLAADDLPAGTPGRAVLGRCDRPQEASQPPFVVDLDGSGGHMAVVGGPRSGVSTALCALVTSLATPQSPDALQVHVLDLTGGCAGLGALPHVGTIAGRDQPELAGQILASVVRELDRRTAAAGVDATRLVVVIDGLAQVRGLPDADQVFTHLATIAATGIPARVHLVVGARRWVELRGALADAIGTRVELRLTDPTESLFGRHRAAQLPADTPGRGLLVDGTLVQLVRPDIDGCAEAATRLWPGRHAPAVRTLPIRVIEPDDAGDGSFALGIGGPDATPLTLDLFTGGAHLVVTGDGGSGRSTVLRRLVRALAAAGPDRVTVHLLDPRRSMLDLARLPAVATFVHHQQSAALGGLLGALTLRLPAPDVVFTGPAAAMTIARDAGVHEGGGGVEGGGDGTGTRSRPQVRHVLVIDDADLLDLGPLAASPVARALADLAGLVPHSGEIGLQVMVARSATARAGDPLSLRLRASAPWQLALPGEHLEGPAAGRGAPVGVGRGLVRRGNGRAIAVQCYAERAGSIGAPGCPTP